MTPFQAKVIAAAVLAAWVAGGIIIFVWSGCLTTYHWWCHA